MGGTLEQRLDGSVALFISGDLQFDSNDEKVYHEALVLPALASALARTEEPLRALVIGGGDGFVVRELLKSDRVERIDLVDYDPVIVGFANNELQRFNGGSLSHPKVSVHIEDAWPYVDRASAEGIKYDLIISDLTVPDDITSARFHSIDWYAKLDKLSHQNTVIAINACSPDETPKAFCSIINSLLEVGYLAQPCRTLIPSFIERGYGEAWGFIVASRIAINLQEIEKTFEAIGPRNALLKVADLQNLFLMPEELIELQKIAAPARAGSDILLQYFLSAGSDETLSGATYDALEFSYANAIVPQAHAGKTVLPPSVIDALRTALHEHGADASESTAFQTLVDGVMEAMPPEQREHSSALVEDFLTNPSTFLRTFELKALINMLLQRAEELPSNLVSQLSTIRHGLDNWVDENINDLSLSHSALTVLALVIILGNLLYPDMAYGKGHTGHAHEGDRRAATQSHQGHTARGRTAGRGRGYANGFGNGYGYGGTYVNPLYKKRTNVVVPGKTIVKPSPNVEIQNYGQKTAPAIKGSLDLQRSIARIESEKADLQNYLAVLQNELNAFSSTENATVLFGTHEIPAAEAVRKTKQLIAKTEGELAILDRKNLELVSSLEEPSGQAATENS